MAFLRFPFSFPPNPNPNKSSPFPVAMVAAPAAATACVGVGIAATMSSTRKATQSHGSSHQCSPAWASVSLSVDSSGVGTSVDNRTGMAFPTIIDGTKRRLLGVGLRRKSLFGLKNIDVYAFGVYADDDDIKKLGDRYGTFSIPELKDKREFYGDVLDEDIRMTVRLQIVYGRLSIRSVRNAFEESVGSRLKKFSQSDNKDLLQRFTSLFKDEYKIPRGTQIDLSREQGYTLQTTIDGKEMGCIQSKLLCKSILDLYIGEEPFDKKAKEEIQHSLASLLQV